ncbi:MAG: uncharacterized protein JWM78_2996 [Verrucomicrobiaceae bacterium]|nr:uncharacterized protein [Verrucomicrobiaceae bacterium]
MNFNLTEEQHMLSDSVRRFLENECGLATGRDNKSSDQWAKIAELGWLAIPLPESVGGLGGGAVETTLIMEEFGRVLAVEPFCAIGVVAAQLILAADSRQAEVLLPQLIAGNFRPIVAHHEHEARGVIEHVSLQANAHGDKWLLSGRKSLVVGANAANRFIVSARTDGDLRDRAGITLFSIACNAPGLQQNNIRLIDNRWAAELIFDNVEVSAMNVLGEVGEGYRAIDHAYAHGLLAQCAEAVGVMEQALWITRDYIKTRKQFGVALNTFQALQHRMAEMLIELELARSVVYRSLAFIDAPTDERNAALSLAKIKIGQAVRFVCGQAIQLHGGIGVTEEYSIGHYFKRAMTIENELGSSHFHLAQLADLELRKSVAWVRE